MAYINNKSLRLNSTIGDLQLSCAQIDISEKVSKLNDVLKNDSNSPGVILMNGPDLYSMISRRVFFESMSQPFSLELYSNRTVDSLFENTQIANTLVLHESIPVAKAAMLSLERAPELIYEPIVVQLQNSKFRLLDVHQLLLAQSRIHLLTVNSLKEANEFKSEVLSIASHDLKNPLNSIMCFARMIKDETAEGNLKIDTIGECAEMIFNSSKKMLEMITKLLDSSAIESSLLQMEIAEVDFVALVENIIALNEKLAIKKNQNIVVRNLVKETIYIKADSARLGAAIDNIVSNAVKYSPLSSSIEIQIRQIGTKVYLEIKDHGPGIKEEEKARLFCKFSKLSAKPTGGESSTGLGLYIAKQTVMLHDGDITLESELGKGSNFIIELPFFVNEKLYR